MDILDMIDNELINIVLLSLFVSFNAVILSTIIGIPIGIKLGKSNNKNLLFADILINTGMGLPPVLVGLVIYLLFARNGVLGDIRILFTPTAMIIAQFVLTLPIIVGVTASTIRDLPKDFELVIKSLGADDEQIRLQMLLESRNGILTGIVLALGRAFSEVGAIMIVGGNIRYSTRVLTTSIITEISRGANDTALILGIILLMISLSITSVLTILQRN